MTRQIAERRKRDRIDCEIDSPSMGIEGSGTPAILKNISRSGLACISRSQLPEMTLVEMAIQLPALPEADVEYYSFQCKGAVVRSEPLMRGKSRHRWLTAIYFTDVDESNLQVLQRYIATRS